MEVIDLPQSPDKIRFEQGEVSTQYFDSARKFRRVLKGVDHRLPFSINEVMEHEGAHVETAMRLGYPAQYCLSTNGFYYQPGSWINDGRIREIQIDDLIAILSAPKEPGHDDELKINYLKMFKKAFYPEENQN